jgi:hypothetical protein
VAGTQAIYHRDEHGTEPVAQFIEALPAKRVAKIDVYIEERLNGQAPDGGFQAANECEAAETASRRWSRRSATSPNADLTYLSI